MIINAHEIFHEIPIETDLSSDVNGMVWGKQILLAVPNTWFWG
jgi:hypothetical protein